MLIRRVMLLSAFLVLAAGGGTLFAHDFWLVPDAFQVAVGSPMTVRGQTGLHFPGSESAVTPERIADARILSATGEERLTDFSVAGKSLVIAHHPTTPGERVIAMALQTRTQRQSAAGFSRYLSLEGAADVVARYQREGAMPTDSVTMRNGKFAKTLVQVGTGGATAFARAAGHPLEFVPVDNVAVAHAGDTVRVRVLFRGKPLAAAHVHAGIAPESEGAAAQPDASLTADANGVVAVPVTRGGLWNLRTGFAAPSAGGGAGEWEVDWATFVFRTAGGSAASAGGEVALPAHPTDSAEAAAAVTAFHTALARGDSAAVLAMLAPDVTIMEAGGIERLADYRTHHLADDIEFARAVPSKSSPLAVTLGGHVAWVTSTSTTQGTFKGRATNSSGAELMVLTKATSGRWQIRAVHWSSRRKQSR